MCFRPAAVKEEEFVECPHCGEKNPKGNVLCSKCAKKLAGAKPAAPAVPAVPGAPAAPAAPGMPKAPGSLN